MTTGKYGWRKIRYILKKRRSDPNLIHYSLEVKDLSLITRDKVSPVTLVSDFNLTLSRGECVGVVGESGSGKTITALSIMGLLPSAIHISSGEIRFPFEGILLNLASQAESNMQDIRGNRISMIFQEPMSSMNPVIRCGKQVSEAILAHRKLSRKAARKKVLELFHEVRLPDPQSAFDKYPHQLSGGQLQRIMIAMAISCEPDILIADEPTTALDVTVQRSIIELLKQIQSDHGMSILFISHDLGVIKMIADRVIVMYEGKIAETGTAEKIYNNPTHPYTQGLIACRPRLDSKKQRLPTIDEYLSWESLSAPMPQAVKKVPEPKGPPVKKDILLRMENISIHYPVGQRLLGRPAGYFHAVKNISFELRENETLGIIGESGSGKSSIGRSIIRLTDTSSGNISYRGKFLPDLSGAALKEFRQRVQIIFQDPYSSLNPRQKIGESLTEVMKVHGLSGNRHERLTRAGEILSTVKLSEGSFHRYPHEFSGGQRQRIVIARALAAGPEFIICDESVSGLDVSIQARILNLLNELKQDMNLTYIFISHDLAVVKYMSDRILVLKDGKIVEKGEADQIYQKPESDYTKELLLSIPD